MTDKQQDQRDKEAWQAMVESRQNRFLKGKNAEGEWVSGKTIVDPDHTPLLHPRQVDENPPQVTDFTEIVASVTKDGEYAVRVLLDSGQHIVVGRWVGRDEAEKHELAINQAMIEYRTKRNAWEFDRITQEHKRITAGVRKGG